ncbi:MAG: outer membrane protein transport protein [Bacteroidetes bacterium]|nr:outer membrane protein transport protein [Bacteroidota bacterium]
MIKKIAFLACSFIPALFFAQGFQVNVQGAAQVAMGSAATAFIQDGAAVFYNPGGGSFLKQNCVYGGVTPIASKGEFLQSNTNVLSKTTSPISTPFGGYIVWGADSAHRPVFSKFKFGLGAYTPFGSTIQWQNGWSGRYDLTSIQLFAVFIQPTVSFKINEKWGIGAGFVYATGKVNLQQDVPVWFQDGTAGHATIQGNATGYGANAGIYFKPSNKLSFGLTYRSQVSMSVKNGAASFNVPASTASNFPTGGFTGGLPLPQVLTFGVAYKPIEKLTLALDASWVGWYSYDTVTFKYSNPTPALSVTKLPRNYTNGYSFRLGAQYQICKNWVGRAGVAYMLSPVKNGYETPDIPDSNHASFSLGLGYRAGKHFTFNASFLFEHIVRKNADNSNTIILTPGQTATPLSGTYNTFIFAPSVSVSFNFLNHKN